MAGQAGEKGGIAPVEGFVRQFWVWPLWKRTLWSPGRILRGYATHSVRHDG
jgi:hypothetical protein